MPTQNVTEAENRLQQLEQDVSSLLAKHNQLVMSLRNLLTEIKVSPLDPLTGQLSERQLDEFVTLIQQINQKSENPIPSSGHTAWD